MWLEKWRESIGGRSPAPGLGKWQEAKTGESIGKLVGLAGAGLAGASLAGTGMKWAADAISKLKPKSKPFEPAEYSTAALTEAQKGLEERRDAGELFKAYDRLNRRTAGEQWRKGLGTIKGLNIGSGQNITDLLGLFTNTAGDLSENTLAAAIKQDQMFSSKFQGLQQLRFSVANQALNEVSSHWKNKVTVGDYISDLGVAVDNAISMFEKVKTGKGDGDTESTKKDKKNGTSNKEELSLYKTGLEKLMA